MPSVADALAIENSREAGLIGGIAALLPGTIVTTLGSGIGSDGLAIGALTAILFFVLLVALNLYRW